MACRVLSLTAVAVLVLSFAGCSQVERPRRAAWRQQAEEACVARGEVRFSRYIAPRGSPIDGPGTCGLTQPYMVGALSEDRVQLDSVATLDCPMVAALNTWIAEVVQPDAQARFGQPVVQIDTMGSYSCRAMNGQAGGHISEHAYGNAIDIAGFRLAGGRRLTVVHDWTRGDDQSQAFLRDVHAGACNTFTTVLGPGYNAFHYNHIHVDLAMHGGSSRGPRRYCKPIPEQSRPGPRQDNLPEAPQMDEEQDVASNAPPAVGRSERGPALGAPPPYEGAGSASRAYAASRGHGNIDANGAMPEGAPMDWDATSSIRPR
jgi:hypothetical protein